MQILRWNRFTLKGGLIVWRLISNQVGSSVLLNPALHRFTGYCSACFPIPRVSSQISNHLDSPSGTCYYFCGLTRGVKSTRPFCFASKRVFLPTG
nr:unnamed protein product [Callosobruchus analis]